jgi:TrpR-related protein YerC/YecD
MAKFTKQSKLAETEKEKLLMQLCLALSKLESPLEAARFLRDLMSSQEAEMFAKRLKIADLLLENLTYAEISRNLKVSPVTISRVHEWLKLSGDGYRVILEKISKQKNNVQKQSRDSFNSFSWEAMKRKYPMYFWPQLLLETIVKNAKETDKRRFRSILKEMDKKTDLYKRLDVLLGGGIK